MVDSEADSHGTQRAVSKVVVGIVIASLAVLLMPTPAGMTVAAQRLLAVTVLMAGLWMTQAISLAATSLLPLALYPLLQIQSAKVVSKAYINDNVFLYLGGFIIALCIERWGLPQRIALNIVSVVGVSPRRLVLGFLIASASLSMWISNTATTLLMLPIALALLKTLDEQCNSGESEGDGGSGLSASLAIPLLLAIAYASSIGGLTTIVGTPTNIAAVEIYRNAFVSVDDPADEVSAEGAVSAEGKRITKSENSELDVSVAGWMLACVPIGAVYLIIAWLVLTFRLPSSADHESSLRSELRQRLADLGKPSTAERRVSVVFALTALMWVFRSQVGTLLTHAFPRSGDIATAVSYVNDSTISVGMAILVFCIPSGTRNREGQSEPLMNWETASRLPWDIMLLFGGGFALAGAFESSGLSEWFGEVLQGPLQGQPIWIVIAVLCLLMTFLTEFTSNVATVNTLLPTLCVLCVKLGVDPRTLIVPATLATSCAFMLPIATPPNAIIFGSGRIQVREMMGYGLILNLVGIPILTAATFLVIKPLMGIP